MDPYIGRKLDGRYELLERIGTGGMAVVYKGKDDRLNRLVAVKILKSDLAQDEDFRRRFNAESQAVAQLSHPNIVSVYDVSKGGDTEYIVMELIDGITLKQYMEKRGQLNWRESLHFITQIMRGLSHAHSRGIVHRDIKPQNIMVLRDGSVKVADFGIACLENSTQTLTQEALGSVHYISPEQARGDRTDARSDIYSAGVVLYEMLTGRLPFEGDSPVSVAIQHLSSIPLAPREINPDIPEQMELICMKAMAADLDRRYLSADEMIQDLEAFRKNPDVDLDFGITDIRPPETVDEPTLPLRTSGAYAAAVHRASHERDSRREYGEEDEAPSGRKRVQTVLLVIVGVLAVALAFVLFRSVLDSLHQDTQPTEQYVVKSVVGMTVAQARELDGVKDIFEVVEEGEISSEEFPAGTIAKQDPEKDSYRKGDNLVIRVWVSSGEETGVMPDVSNQTVSQAEKITLKSLIQQYELNVQALEEDMQYHETVAAGYIISSIPAAGEVLKRGDTIRLFVSKGPQTAPLPQFVGLQIDQVTSQLEFLGLTSGGVELVFSDQPAGTIVAQDPAPKTEVASGAKVSFSVSKGPESTETEPPVTPGGPETEGITFPLPTDRETGFLEIYQDGERLFADTVDCTAGNFFYEFTADGETHIVVYLDREEIYNKTVTIGA